VLIESYRGAASIEVYAGDSSSLAKPRRTDYDEMKSREEKAETDD
jgi:hypothetical protein